MAHKDDHMPGLDIVLPSARRSDLVIQETADDLLVYDTRTEKAHHLNETAATVWRACGRSETYGDVARRLERRAGTKIDSDLIELTVSDLRSANLLDTKETAGPNVSRREVLSKYAAATALALPVVMSLVAPTAAQTGSCIPIGGTGCLLQGAPPCCPPSICVPLGVPGVNIGTCNVVIN